MNTYNTMIPAYIKDDAQFTKVYKYIESVFEQINKTCEDIRDDMVFSSNSSAFIKCLTLFGQSPSFKGEVFRVNGLVYDSSSASWTVKITSSKEDVTIILGRFSTYISAKFNTLKNNFDGTFGNLRESLSKAFTLRNDYMIINCTQNLVEDEDEIIHPALILTVSLSSLLVNKFPPESAYLAGEEPWIIDNIDPAWILESQANEDKYNFYKDFLDLITLFQNGYFKLDILGVLTTFEISGNAPIFRWGHSRWNNSLWSNTTVTEV